VQTEQYARRICSIAGIELPSFRELLENQNITTSSTVNAGGSPMLTSTNYSPPLSNDMESTAVVSASASVAATAPGSMATSGSESKRIGLKVHAVMASFVGIGAGIGMFLS
jgi:hypothetical protein